MCGLRIFAEPLMYHLYRVTSYLQLLALCILTCRPNMSFLVRLVLDNSKSLGNMSWSTVLPSHPRKNFCTASQFSFIARPICACSSDLTLDH